MKTRCTKSGNTCNNLYYVHDYMLEIHRKQNCKYSGYGIKVGGCDGNF